MPFRSKRQMKAAFATNGFGGKINPQEFADATPNKKKLPNRVKPKKRGSKRKDDRQLVRGIFT